MNGDEEEIRPQQKKPSIFVYFLYGSILLLVMFLFLQTFLLGASEINIITVVTQNVEENLNCECKIFFDDGKIQTYSENFTLPKYGNKEFSYKMVTKKKRIAVFGECYCKGENHYEQSKAYLAELTFNQISFYFAFLKNNTNVSYNIKHII